MEKKSVIFNLKQLPKKTFEIEATIPWEIVADIQKSVIEKIKANTQIKGFRKGKAPENLAISSYGEEKFLEDVLQQLISQVYPEAIQKLNLKPIVPPKIELASAKEKENWIIKFTSCEEPEINLSNYKEEIKKEISKDKIWVPGKDAQPDENKEENKDEKLNRVLNWLIENTQAEIGDLIIETETNHKLVDLVEDLRKLNLSLDQYLSSTGKTVESLKNEYKTQAEKTIKLQLILKKIADTENITVEEKDINSLIETAKNEKEKKALESQKYYLASIIRQQKVLDFLSEL